MTTVRIPLAGILLGLLLWLPAPAGRGQTAQSPSAATVQLVATAASTSELAATHNAALASSTRDAATARPRAPEVGNAGIADQGGNGVVAVVLIVLAVAVVACARILSQRRGR
jgi:multisubunit Na+/H+ antiporter MnhB subunit